MASRARSSGPCWGRRLHCRRGGTRAVVAGHYRRAESQRRDESAGARGVETLCSAAIFVLPAFACRLLSWVGIAGTLEFGVLGYLPFYCASPIAPAFSSGLSPIHMGVPDHHIPRPPIGSLRCKLPNNFPQAVKPTQLKIRSVPIILIIKRGITLRALYREVLKYVLYSLSAYNPCKDGNITISDKFNTRTFKDIRHQGINIT